MSKPSRQDERCWREEEMATAIEEYLSEHPHASDTLEGIAGWWIIQQQIRVEVKTLKKVLAQLVGRGLLEEIRNGGRAQYRLKACGR
ncbi:hypothetical protein HUU05_23755 [candidate division KSB1 bacterium]|nr:hypothetical protein [candidate division KSB1 bacterium]